MREPRTRSGASDRDRGQAYTLEGIVGALLVLMGLLLALQAVSITPTTPGTVDQDTRAQLRQQANDVLSAAHDDEALRNALLMWNASATQFYHPTHDVSDVVGYGAADPPNAFGEMLNQTFTQREYSYNVVLEYHNVSDRTKIEEAPMVVRGEPTDNAVAASYVVTLYDSMTLTAPGYDDRLGELRSDDFFAPDAFPKSPIRNVVRVRVVVW